MVYRHFAWFHRLRGHWLAEWAGYVPAPDVPLDLVGDARLTAMNVWRRRVQDDLAAHPCVEDSVDLAAWQACEPGAAVCVDVTRFHWPVGDHVWHRFDDVLNDIDPAWGEEHKFIEVRMDTLEVVANQSSHRPIRDAVPGQRVFDITGSPMAAYHGQIWGRFVWLGDRWGFEPTQARQRWNWPRPIWSLRHAGRPTVPASTQKALAEAPIDLGLVPTQAIKEKVAV